MKHATITPEFVEFIPKELAEGVLYISRPYKTAAHRCFCGCGTKIVTPLKPGFWSLAESDGQVSLYPSVGNWNHPCRSHYVIAFNQVRWANTMTQAQINRGRARDRAWIARNYPPSAASAQPAAPAVPASGPSPQPVAARKDPSAADEPGWRRAWRKLFR